MWLAGNVGMEEKIETAFVLGIIYRKCYTYQFQHSLLNTGERNFRVWLELSETVNQEFPGFGGEGIERAMSVRSLVHLL